MKTPAPLAVLLSALLAASSSAIDFTPRFTDVVDDGVPMRRMYFKDGARRIYYHPPVSWERLGDAETAIFKLKDSNQASVRIRNAPAEQARIPLDEPGLESLRRIASSLIPGEATGVREIWESVNPVVLQGWTSFEIGFDYAYFGRRVCRSILFINLDAERQIYFIIDAAPADFQPLYRTAYRTLATWWEPESAGSQ